ncbi:MAG: EAL domain-containing protein [Pseudomonadota bacterium]
MFRARRFRTKLLLFMMAPLLAVQIMMLLAVLRLVQQDVTETATESLSIGVAVAEEYLSARRDQLSNASQVLASDFGLKQSVATDDEATILSVLDNHSRRVGAKVAAIVDLDGDILAANAELPGLDTTLLADADNEELIVKTLMVGNTPHQVFVVPLKAPVTIAWVVLGFTVDTELAARIETLTGLEVSIAVLNDRDREGRSTRAFDPLAPLNTVYTHAAGNDEWLSIHTPFAAHSNDVIVVLQQSMQAVLAPYLSARRNLLLFGAALLILAGAAIAWFSQTVSEPLRVLGKAARQMMSGNYSYRVELESGDEFGRLADSFNAMRTAIADRERHISHYATHDALTDLPNRTRILRDLESVIGSGSLKNSCLSALSIHLNKMAEISSALGHSANDELIKLAAERLRQCSGDRGTVAHIGTNEFAVTLPGLDTNQAIDVAETIQSALEQGNTLGQLNIVLNSVIGVASYPYHAKDANELLRFASVARVEADTGRHKLATYELHCAAQFQRRLRIINDIPSAIRDRQIEVWFQPKARLPDANIVSVECLVRWTHPELGPLSPDDFIPAAESTGSIIDLSRYVLTEACRAARAFSDAGYDICVAVNLSTRDLLDDQIESHVKNTLTKFDVPTGKLILEVTESSIMEDVPTSVAVLERLRSTGIRVSMDDFGTGHSSLAQLRQIPMDELKIDKAFVDTLISDPHNEDIVRTVIRIAHGMKLEVVAEGVEDEESARRLAGMGCERIQGYFLSKPLPIDEFTTWLGNYQPSELSERRSDDRAFALAAANEPLSGVERVISGEK